VVDRLDFASYVIEKGLILIPALYVLGMIIKHTQFLEDKYIPAILLVIGIGGAVALLGLNVEAVIQGVLVSGAAVFTNQLIKQANK
jgi:hypothetical protein